MFAPIVFSWWEMCNGEPLWMFGYLKLSNTVDSLSGSDMKYTLSVGWVGFIGLQLESRLPFSLENYPFLVWNCFLPYQFCHSL